MGRLLWKVLKFILWAAMIMIATPFVAAWMILTGILGGASFGETRSRERQFREDYDHGYHWDDWEDDDTHW